MDINFEVTKAIRRKAKKINSSKKTTIRLNEDKRKT